LERAEQSTLWITASEDGASATCVGVAPACKELRSGPNKSEREPTSARSTNYGSGHLIPAFHGTGRTFSLLPSHPLDAASGSIDAPLVSCLRGKVPRPKMVSSNQKRFQLCFVRNSPRGTSEPRVLSPKTRTPPESAALGGGLNRCALVGPGRHLSIRRWCRCWCWLLAVARCKTCLTASRPPFRNDAEWFVRVPKPIVAAAARQRCAHCA
jgi:hypothetical protein